MLYICPLEFRYTKVNDSKTEKITWNERRDALYARTQCKTEQPLQDIELQEKQKEKDQRHIEKLFRKNPKLKGFI